MNNVTSVPTTPTFAELRPVEDDELVDGQLYTALPDSKFYKPFEPIMKRAVSDLRPERVAAVRNKPDDIPAIDFAFGEVLDADGNDLGKPPLPAGASFTPNHLYRENGITYIGRGLYWSDGIETVDGVEYMKFRYSDVMPCEKFEWCTGHYLADLIDGDEEWHHGEQETIWSFGKYRMTVNREVDVADGVMSEGYTVDLDTDDRSGEGSRDLPSLEFLATQLEDAATRLRSFVAREE